MKHLVFVYGSLKKGRHNHFIIAGGTYLGPATTGAQFQMHSYGSFPALVSGDKAYEGELYEVDDRIMASLDRLESYPEFYTRNIYTVSLGGHSEADAWIYTLADESGAQRLPTVDRSAW